MKQTVLGICVILFTLQLCNAATVREAEYKLQLLREAATETLEEVAFQHEKIVRDINYAVDSTINEGKFEIVKYFKEFENKLKSAKVRKHLCQGSRDHFIFEVERAYAHELAHCIDDNGKDSVNFVSLENRDVAEHVWNGIYEEEKQIIQCHGEPSCLDSVIEKIEKKIGDLSNGLEDKINISRQNENDHLKSIRLCLNKGVIHAKTVLHSFPLCVHYDANY